MKVAVLIVLGFIALLKVAVTTAVLGHIRVEALIGVTDVTVGGAKGLPGVNAFGFLSGSLHPVARTNSRNAGIQILLIFTFRMCISSSPALIPELC
jgi:hypothetical protein